MGKNGVSQPPQLQHQLHGFSGCLVEVWRLDTHSLVRKTANRPERNHKLELELQKLQRLAAIATDTALFYVPAVQHTGLTEDGRAFYEMDFVPGWSLDAYLAYTAPAQIERLAEHIYQIIVRFSELPAMQKTASKPAVASQEQEFLRAKFHETGAALVMLSGVFPAARPLVAQYNELVNAISYPATATGQLSFCHGDFALDNVLVDRQGKLVLIDPLANGHESFMWDISKVFQSSLVRWRQIKAGQFELNLERGKILLQDSERMAWFNHCYAQHVLQRFDATAVTLYLAATIARATKYAQTAAQLCALLLLTNELISRYLERRCDLYEPLGPLCR